MHANPRKSANLISMLMFGWTIPVFRRTNNKDLDSNDVFEPLDADRSRTLGNQLERYAANSFQSESVISHLFLLKKLAS